MIYFQTGRRRRLTQRLERDNVKDHLQNMIDLINQIYTTGTVLDKDGQSVKLDA